MGWLGDRCRDIWPLMLVICFAFDTTAYASFMWASETRSVTNVHDWNNPPGFGSSTISSTGQFEDFVVSGRASQNSKFYSSGGAAHRPPAR